MTTLTKAQIKAAEVEANRQDAFVKKVRSLLGHVSGRVLSGPIITAYKAGVTADAFAATIAAQEPVGAAVHTVKAEAVDQAEKWARETVAKVTEELAAAGWDIDAVAAYPSSMRNSREDYRRKHAKYQLFHGITRKPEGSPYAGRRGEPNIVEMAPDRIERFVDQARQDAAIAYDAFIVKLVGKIGANVEDAKLVGNHVWSRSTLYILRENGEAEKWMTQQITNYSVYGTPYAQWPTRKVK